MIKIGAVAVVVGLVVVCYLFLLVVMPVVVDMAASANTTMAATSNMTNYPGTSGMLVSVPWVLFFLPGAIGMVVIVLILKTKP